MADDADGRVRKPTVSRWPPFVAIGVVVSELGVVFGFFPVTVGGLLLFGWSVAAILREAGYLARPAWALTALGLLLGGLGLVAVASQVGLAELSLAVVTDPTRPVVYRGAAITMAGLVLLAMAGVLAGRPAR